MKQLRWWALAAASVLVLVLISAQQTGALWRDQAAVGNATITSGQLTILAGGQSNYPWTDFGGTNLTSGSVVQEALTISIAGDTKAGYRLQSVTSATQNVPLTFTAWTVGNAASCPAVGNPTNILAGPWTSFPNPTIARTVTVGASEVWCIRATVGATATPGKSTTVTLNFRAEQQV